MPRATVTLDLGPAEPEPDAAIPRPIHEDSEGGPLAMLPVRRGERVGRYRVRERLGHGGMGVVFKALDPELGRTVALKLVRHRAGERPDPRHTARLRREARALARLNHRNVVHLYDLGSTARGIFLAMEFIAGQSLTAWMTERERTPSEILGAYRQAGRGLAAAHRAGIIHRDFKPTNVIIDRKGHVTVVDFGLARGIEPDEAPDDSDVDWAVLTERLTRRNVILGTKGFMAPEQLLALDVTPASDQFSFCVSLFEALYRVRPYPGTNAVETAKAFARGEMIEPPPKKGIPRYVLRALQRGLAIEPENRFPSMNALLAALSPPHAQRRRRRALIAAFVATASVSAALSSWATGDRDAGPQVCASAEPSALP